MPGVLEDVDVELERHKSWEQFTDESNDSMDIEEGEASLVIGFIVLRIPQQSVLKRHSKFSIIFVAWIYRWKSINVYSSSIYNELIRIRLTRIFA